MRFKHRAGSRAPVWAVAKLVNKSRVFLLGFQAPPARRDGRRRSGLPGSVAPVEALFGSWPAAILCLLDYDGEVQQAAIDWWPAGPM